MRKMLIAAAAVSVLGAAASGATAQVLDRYGSQNSYAPPAAGYPVPTRVLTWAGKTMPQAQSPQAPSSQAWAQPPAGAPQPIMPRPSAPQGQPVTVAPQAFYPPQVMYYPQAYQTLTGQPAAFAQPAPPVQSQFQPTPTAPLPPAPQPQAAPAPAPALPTSIYQPPRPLAAAEPARAVQLAAATPPGQGVRTYSIHRPFGRTPDPIPTPPAGFDSMALLLPAEDNPDTLKGEGLGLRASADARD